MASGIRTVEANKASDEKETVMKCYTIYEEAQRGLIVNASAPGDDPALRVGEPGSCNVIPVSRDLRAVFEERQKFISHIRTLLERCENKDLFEGAERELREELRKAQMETPGLNAQLEEAKRINPKLRGMAPHFVLAHIWGSEYAQSMRVVAADLSDNEPLRLIKERGDSSTCLVHVATKAPLDGQLWFESSSWDEELEDTRWGKEVTRVYRPFPPPGVEVIATGLGPVGEPEVLLLMQKRASFRICRSGDPKSFGDGPDDPQRYPVLVVVWPGSTLRCFPPKKYEKERKAA